MTGALPSKLYDPHFFIQWITFDLQIMLPNVGIPSYQVARIGKKENETLEYLSIPG